MLMAWSVMETCHADTFCRIQTVPACECPNSGLSCVGCVRVCVCSVLVVGEV